MSYTYLTKTELILIEEYQEFGLSGQKIAERLKRGHETICRIIRKLNKGLTAIEVYLEYQADKAKCGRRKIDLPVFEKTTSMKKLLRAGRLT